MINKKFFIAISTILISLLGIIITLLIPFLFKKISLCSLNKCSGSEIEMSKDEIFLIIKNSSTTNFGMYYIDLIDLSVSLEKKGPIIYQDGMLMDEKKMFALTLVEKKNIFFQTVYKLKLKPPEEENENQKWILKDGVISDMLYRVKVFVRKDLKIVLIPYRVVEKISCNWIFEKIK